MPPSSRYSPPFSPPLLALFYSFCCPSDHLMLPHGLSLTPTPPFPRSFLTLLLYPPSPPPPLSPNPVLFQPPFNPLAFALNPFFGVLLP